MLATKNNMALINVTHLNKTYRDNKGKPIIALDDIQLSVEQGEFFILLGPSGCGKSTLLRIMSGLDTATHGNITFDPSITEQDFSFVFQQFAILPWLTVSQNIALGLIARNIPKHEQEKIIRKELETLGLSAFAHRYPKELSGGMKQRVGIARALATNPKVIFLDEPFSALDSFTATELRKELIKLWQERGMTIIMVTHNIQEAIELGDDIAVMSARPGKIEQIVKNQLPRPRMNRSEPFFELEDKLSDLVKV